MPTPREQEYWQTICLRPKDGSVSHGGWPGTVPSHHQTLGVSLRRARGGAPVFEKSGGPQPLARGSKKS